MIKKVYVPKYLYPLSSVLYNFIIFLISLIVLVLLGIFTGNYPTLHWLLIVFPLLVLLIMTFGVGMILATIGVFFRDMEYLWEVAPVYNVIINVRNIIFHEAFNWGCMTYACVFALVSVVVGVIVFHKNQDKFILYI